MEGTIAAGTCVRIALIAIHGIRFAGLLYGKADPFQSTLSGPDRK
jgi:hypothetical protein